MTEEMVLLHARWAYLSFIHVAPASLRAHVVTVTFLLLLQDPGRFREQLHVQDVPVPIHQLLLQSHVHSLLQGAFPHPSVQSAVSSESWRTTSLTCQLVHSCLRTCDVHPVTLMDDGSRLTLLHCGAPQPPSPHTQTFDESLTSLHTAEEAPNA